MCWQLRNLLWATSKHDVYLMRESCIKHWDDVARRSSKVQQPFLFWWRFASVLSVLCAATRADGPNGIACDR